MQIYHAVLRVMKREKEVDYMKTITALKKQNKSLKVMLQTAKQRHDAIQ